MQVLKSSYLKVQRVFKYRQKKQARKLPFFSKSRHTKQHKHHSSRSCHIIQVQAQGPVLKVFSFYVQIQEAVLMLLFLPTLSTRINPQSLQLVLWLIFSLKNNKMKQCMLHMWCTKNDWAPHVHKISKAPAWVTHLEQVWTSVLHLLACDTSKLCHVSGYAPTRFGLGEAGWAPHRLTQAS
jgi:hypothetical protein